MSELQKKSIPKWLEKLKKVKHIEIYIAIIFIVVILLIYLSSVDSQKGKSNSNSGMSITTYVNDLEENLEDILSNIGGVSNVNVMITLDFNSAVVENSNITLSEFPKVKGIIVTAKGLNSTAKKMSVLHAIEAVIDVTNGNIEIISSD